MGGHGLGEVQIQEFGQADDVPDPHTVPCTAEGGEAASQEVVNQVRAAPDVMRFVEYRRVQSCPPPRRRELVRNGAMRRSRSRWR